jgi:hypothetical protein
MNRLVRILSRYECRTFRELVAVASAITALLRAQKGRP